MDGSRFIYRLGLRNLLSFGGKRTSLELEPLNVLIGPNASGKSNFIEAIRLLAAAPTDLTGPMRAGGGVSSWIWKGKGASSIVEIEATFRSMVQFGLDYHLAFTERNLRLQVVDESMVLHPMGRIYHVIEPSVYRFNNGEPTIKNWLSSSEFDVKPLTGVSSQGSILSQVRGLDVYREITELAEQLDEVSFFRGWDFGRDAAPRVPQRADLPDSFVLEDASNLGLVLSDLEHRGVLRQVITKYLAQVYVNLQDITVRVQSGHVQVFFHEKGVKTPIAATRVSDGTLHYLTLLAILCHPEPPSLICIEEPELGLHPDVIPAIADLLREASLRTQLIVTTHSETLVSRLSDLPEAIVVCERDEDGTHLRRLEPDKLREWLDKYMLGELWRMGELGGNPQ